MSNQFSSVVLRGSDSKSNRDKRVSRSTLGTAVYNCIEMLESRAMLSGSPVAPPVFTINPVHQTTLVGSTAVFSVAASGNPTFQWQYTPALGAPWSNIAGATSTTYSVIASGQKDESEYRAVATGAGETVDSLPAELTVQYLPSSGLLAGTVIGTTGSYKNQGNIAANAFDGELKTFFDAPTANGNWVGLDLGVPQVLTSVAYASRTGFQSRMNGGIIQASNTADFSSGVVNLYKIASNANPSSTSLTTQPITSDTAYRYVRYLAPAGSYGNIAELQISGHLPTVASLNLFGGNIFGTTGSYKNDGNTVSNAEDGDIGTFFDASTGNDDVVGLDLGFTRVLQQITFAPRNGYAYRMVGGIFQASNSADFSSGVVNLYTVTSAPVQNALTSIGVSVTTPYRYLRYLAPDGSYGNIAEILYFG